MILCTRKIFEKSTNGLKQIIKKWLIHDNRTKALLGFGISLDTSCWLRGWSQGRGDTPLVPYLCLEKLIDTVRSGHR